MGTRLRIGVFLLAYAAAPAFAWVYPEHRDITVLAVESLDPDRRRIFDGLWAEARAGNETRLCEQSADGAQSVAPECIDWAAMPAIAGDHSCSSKQMLDDGDGFDVDPPGGRRGGATESRSRARRGESADTIGRRAREIDRRAASATRKRGRARADGQRAAGGRHPVAARGSRVCDARRIEQRALSAPAPETRFHQGGILASDAARRTCRRSMHSVCTAGIT